MLNASGPRAEQSKPHLHFHVVPRWTDDGFTTWTNGRSSKKIPENPVRLLEEAVGALSAK
ncbi:hypothetical protein [Arthrobacter sp. UYEF21]|uniref:hypothetical protein n=1 Tax=Arthrobacter sp. UYEF21 TaxID=1756364 RepID=UPI003395E824